MAASSTDAMPALRVPVTSGAFFGAKAAEASAALADFIVENSAAMALRQWFGEAALAELLAHDNTPSTRRLAINRLEDAVDRDIAALDRLLSAQLEALLAAERLRRLESSWRGLSWLCSRVPPGAKVRVRMLQLRWAELCRDFERATEFDQSQLFKKVYEDEFGTPGGEPFGLLCGDWELRPTPGPGSPTDDIAGLDGLAAVAAAAFSPTVVAGHPALLGLESFNELNPALDPTEPMRLPERRRWRGLQERDDTRFLGVLAPRAMVRGPWADSLSRADQFRFLPNPGAAEARLWMNAVYPFAAIVIRAFTSWGWPADIRGAQVSETALAGVVDGLRPQHLPSDLAGAPPRPPVEVAFTDEQERQMVEAGLIPLAGLEAMPDAVFAAVPSLHRPPRMLGGESANAANANQRLSAQFNAVLCVSRFAHCIKMMGRQMTGSYKTADDIQDRLQQWLLGFASASSSGRGEAGARQPLRNARVQVTEKPGQPGVFGCTIHLQPHYQLDDVGAAFRLVTNLDANRSAA